MKIKILTYNIHKGFDWNNRNYFIKEIKEFIHTSGANIVFLQEVIGENTRLKKKGLIDAQFEYIADSIWSHYSYGKNSVFDHGHHGNLILSQYPITKSKSFDISTNFFEKRNFLISEICLKNKTIYLVCVHFNLLNGGRQLQYQRILHHIKSLNLPDDTPVIIAGDFNDWSKKASKVFENDLEMTEAHKEYQKCYAKTFPAVKPLLCLDRIYVKNVKVIQAHVLVKRSESHFSDHLPLFCELELE